MALVQAQNLCQSATPTLFKFCFILLQTVFAFFTFIWFFLLHLSQLLHLCAVFVLTSKAPRFTLVILKSATLIRTVDSEVRMFIKQSCASPRMLSPSTAHLCTELAASVLRYNFLTWHVLFLYWEISAHLFPVYATIPVLSLKVTSAHRLLPLSLQCIVVCAIAVRWCDVVKLIRLLFPAIWCFGLLLVMC